jgi:predicted transcriptional regulator
MRKILTFRVSDDLAKWLTETARRTGISVSRIIRQELEKTKQEAVDQPFLRLAGAIDGTSDLSARKGFSRT